MKQIILGLILLLFSVTVMAQGPPAYPRDLTLSWTWPTNYVEVSPGVPGAVLEPGILGIGQAFCFDNQQTLVFEAAYSVTSDVGLPQSETFVGAIPAPGTYECFVTAVTVDGISSDLSDVAIVKYTGKPGKATGLTAAEPNAGN